MLCHTTNFVNKFPKYRVVYENSVHLTNIYRKKSFI